MYFQYYTEMINMQQTLGYLHTLIKSNIIIHLQSMFVGLSGEICGSVAAKCFTVHQLVANYTDFVVCCSNILLRKYSYCPHRTQLCPLAN